MKPGKLQGARIASRALCSAVLLAESAAFVASSVASALAPGAP